MSRLGWVLMGLLLACLLAQPLTLLLISGYQQFVSPHKGWHCAYAALHGDTSCSAYGKDAIVRRGVIVGARLLWERFGQCHEAAVALAASSSGKECDCCGLQGAADLAEKTAKEAAKKAVDDAKKKAAEGVDNAVKEAKKKIGDELDKLLGRTSKTPTDGEIELAVNWAKDQWEQAKLGAEYGKDSDYYEGCQRFVARAYSGGKPNSCPFHSYDYPTQALGDAKANKDKYKEPPPKGSWVIYTAKNLDYRGHVALSVGNDMVIHMYTSGGVASVREDKYDQIPGANYEGWVWPNRKSTSP